MILIPWRRKGANIVQRLVDLRNPAISLLVTMSSYFDRDIAIILINDIAICAEDTGELLLQKIYQKADIMCAMAWIVKGHHFYDVLIARQMNGDRLL